MNPPTKGFVAATCIACGNTESLTLDLFRLDAVTCANCKTAVPLWQIREHVAAYVAMLAWIDLAPHTPPVQE